MGAKEDFDKFFGLAKELKLNKDEGEGFINAAMEKKGHKKSFTWTDAEPDKSTSSGGFFGSSSGDGDKKEKDSSADWQYGN